ncbi:MAG TPA: FAD-dependent oxidoreductase [Syntrophorhabdaceae bacterium]|nr:FAD-dependent oxidoreductase [Syntrophorhabdaceae bacterium]
MSNNNFEKLLEPYHIGSVKTRNRMIKSAAGLQYWIQGDNPVTKKALYFFDALARGGVGLIIMESPSIEAGGKSFRLDNEKHIKAMSEVTGIIHQHGCPVFVQLANMSNWNMRKSPEYDTRGASPVCVFSEMDNHGFMPRELTIPEIKEIVQKFINNAVGAKNAGFDGVEINTSCSHLLHTFLSPFWNKRHDEYGCDSLENRTRLLVEIIRGIKERLGSDFPVSAIMNGIETGALIGVDAGECLNFEDSGKIARIIEKAGADAIQVRSQWIGRHDSSFLTDHLFYPEPPVPLSSFPKELDMSRHGAGANANMAAAVKKMVSIPVITVGRLDPELGEQILREGKADFIAMTRRLFADPELPNKIAAGAVEDIAPCTSCTCCKAEDTHRRCRINACIGTEKVYSMEPLLKKKKVLIAGGGPGGMEAARVAARRGHEVTLVEKTGRLGGLLHLAAMVKGLEIENLPAIIRYFSGQFKKLGVNVQLSTELTAELVKKLNPDVLVVATGGTPTVPDIRGIDGPNVVKNTDLHRMLKFFLRFVGPGTLRSLTRFWMPIGKKVVIIGGGMHGCELAEFLVKRNRKVTIVDSTEELGTDIIQHLKQQLFWWFRQKNVELLPGVKPIAITEKGLTVLTKQGYNRTIPADTIVPAIPMKSNTKLADDFRGKVAEVYTVGDCGNPGIIADAIAEGWRVGNAI